MMKTIQRYIAFLLCVHTILFVMFQVAPIVRAENGTPESEVLAEETLESGESIEETTIESEESTEEVSSSESQNIETSEEENVSLIDEEETAADQTLTWMSYADYKASEAARAWNNPELFVGQTAIFNENWGFFFWEVSFEVADDEIEDDYEDDLSVGFEEFLDENGKSIQIVITDYYTDSIDQLWYKVEAAEGYTLPVELEEAPYVMYTNYGIEETDPALLMMPLMGTFVDEQVYLQNKTEGTSDMVDFNKTELPDFFDATFLEVPELVWKGYDLGDISSWGEDFPAEYHYVSESAVVLIPAEVSRAYEALLECESTAMFEAILSYIPEEITSQFTSKHLANLEAYAEHLYVIENVEKDAIVTIGDVSVPVTVHVHGKIPMDGTLSVEAVTSETVMAEGFDIKDASEIVTALDIKILDANGVEWQPEEGDIITISIDMAALGYEDGQIFRLHHKHGEEITMYEVFVVMDGKITLGTSGFSLYVISDFNNFNQTNPPGNATGAQQIVDSNTGSVTLTVGDTVVFYTDVEGENANNLTSTWWVTDPEGAIYYEVYSNRTPNSYGSNGRWIRVTALKQTQDPISLHFLYTDNININNWQNPDLFNRNNMREQSFSLSIVPPKPTAADVDGYKLYIKDTVNTTGTITATLVDGAGNEITEEMLGGSIACSWVRDDDAHIIPNAYQNGGKSIDICRDHGGLLQNRLTNVTYTVTARLPNGREKTASYTVYYQSEIMNASFENPRTTTSTYTFLPNGYPNLFWKTTSPGEWGNLARDIEFARYVENENQNTNFGQNTFHPRRPDDGYQIAEINAENFGALYQDIITAPGEHLLWEFSHAERGTNRDGESMFIILGPTEHAQTLTNYEQLQGLVREIIDYFQGVSEYKTDADVLSYLIDETDGVRNSIRYTQTIDSETKAVYEIWYNDADALRKSSDEAWTEILGEYLVPEKQYRTRLFFVTNPISGRGESNYGNLIDSSRGGQYKDFLIEYYEEEYELDDNGATVLKRKLVKKREDTSAPTDESNRAIMYSSVKLQNYSYFETYENDLLSTVFINGQNSPYNIKYLDYPCLFIESYPKTPSESYPRDTIGCLDDTVIKPTGYYEKYDIVMQVCFRDTMIAVQKWVEFPKIKGTDTEALTAVQKQSLVDGLIKENGVGYQADFHLDCMTEQNHFADNHVAITKNDPSGWYTGYIPIGDNPKDSHTFKLIEESVSPLEGLEIDKVEFKYYQFFRGERTLAKTQEYTNVALEAETVDGKTSYKLVSNDNGTKTDVLIEGIDLYAADEAKKIAEIRVTNTYKEKQVKYNYVAVGNGMITVQDSDKTPTTSDSETFAYYSGKPQGVKPEADTNYTFAGWYLDEKCTVPVDKNHGYVEADGRFVPNKDKTVSDNDLEVTYYAKFSIGSLRIIREHAEPGQVFVYEVKDANGNTMYVTVVVGEDGTGTTEIVDASFGDNNVGLEYTVTQLDDWSWRYKKEQDSITLTHKMTTGIHGAQNMTTVFRFPVEQKGEEPYWLNGNSLVETNTYSGGAN